MNSKSRQTDITVFLAPEQYRPVGICTKEGISSGIEIDEKENNINLYICPEGYNCSSTEITLFMLPENKDATECLGCIPPCDSYRVDYGDFSKTLLDLHNRARATHPDECDSNTCNELKLDRRLMEAAQWKANDFVDNNYYSHTDHLGRDPGDMMRDFGVQWESCGENIAYIEIINGDMPSNTELATDFFNMWMNSPHHRENIMRPEFNAVGFGIAKQEKIENGTSYITIYAVSDFAQIEEHAPAEVPKPSLPCDGECVKKIHWQQEYEVVSQWQDGKVVEKKVPLPYIDMFVEIPESLYCGIEKVELKFEVSPCRAYLEPKTDPEEIPDNNTLKYTIENDAPDGKWTIRWSLDHLACFVPGEWIAAYVYLRGYKGCNPLLIGWNWFETPCWTSGIIQGCGILNSDGSIKEGGYLEEFRESWTGNEGLHWLVYFKGNLFWLKSSDFAEYRIGNRVFIQKDGLSMYVDQQNTPVKEPACRYPVGNGWIYGDTVISDENVDYFLDKDRDVIVPQKFFGIGG